MDSLVSNPKGHILNWNLAQGSIVITLLTMKICTLEIENIFCVWENEKCFVNTSNRQMFSEFSQTSWVFQKANRNTGKNILRGGERGRAHIKFILTTCKFSLLAPS